MTLILFSLSVILILIVLVVGNILKRTIPSKSSTNTYEEYSAGTGCYVCTVCGGTGACRSEDKITPPWCEKAPVWHDSGIYSITPLIKE